MSRRTIAIEVWIERSANGRVADGCRNEKHRSIGCRCVIIVPRKPQTVVVAVIAQRWPLIDGMLEITAMDRRRHDVRLKKPRKTTKQCGWLAMKIHDSWQADG